jgi:aminocarboxymuconate-semialdehyde decarboxylase
LGELEPGQLIHSMPFSAEQKDWLLHGAALEWLNLPIQKFL